MNIHKIANKWVDAGYYEIANGVLAPKRHQEKGLFIHLAYSLVSNYMVFHHNRKFMVIDEGAYPKKKAARFIKVCHIAYFGV